MFCSYTDLGPPLPELDIDDLLNEEKRQELIDVLDQRIKKKDELRKLMITQSMIKPIYINKFNLCVLNFFFRR